jgi:hypothetical protein
MTNCTLRRNPVRGFFERLVFFFLTCSIQQAMSPSESGPNNGRAPEFGYVKTVAAGLPYVSTFLLEPGGGEPEDERSDDGKTKSGV